MQLHKKCSAYKYYIPEDLSTNMGVTHSQYVFIHLAHLSLRSVNCDLELNGVVKRYLGMCKADLFIICYHITEWNSKITCK